TSVERDEYIQLRTLWRDDPILYARHRLGLNPTWQQAKIIEAVTAPGAKVTARSGHGIGKSAALSAVIWWFLECFDYSKIPCTAPTQAQLEQVLWSELAKWLRKADEQAARQKLPPGLWLSHLFNFAAKSITDVGAPKEWFAVARTSRKENPDALQGFHASDVEIDLEGRSVVKKGSGGNILFVIEEASGVPDQIFEVAEGALSSHDARLILVGNPTQTTGYFARSHRQDRGNFSAVLKFRSDESPLVDPAYRARLVKKYGEGSNVVRVRADGEFPRQDDDVLIPLEVAEAAITREAAPPAGVRAILGVDVARYGFNRTTFVERRGNVVPYAEVHARQDTMETAGKAKLTAIRRKVHAIHVDDTGVGGGVTDALMQERRRGDLYWIDASEPDTPRRIDIDVVPVNTAEAAPERRRGHEEQQGFKLRDHLWIRMAEWFRDESPSFAGMERPYAEDLAGECAVTRYKIDAEGRTHIEKKEEMVKRLEGQSPDLADALMLTFHAPVHRLRVRKELII
ncbi:MAG TPA: hypothetical protein VF274_06385, partial [Alphaproteobacteria bacterium]